MTAGKAASQAGHAFLDAFQLAAPDLRRAYLAPGHGTKIVLLAADEIALRRAYAAACDRRLPCTLIIDSGHVMAPFFDGSPIVTALGIGPATRDQSEAITGEFPLM